MYRSGYKHYGTKGNGRCRVYWLPDTIFHQAAKLHTDTVFDDWEKLLCTGKGPATVNLISGSSMAKPISKKNLFLNNTSPDKAPALIKKSLECLQPCTINPTLIVPWARKAEEKFKKEQKIFLDRRKSLIKRYPEKNMKDIRKMASYRRVEKKRNKARGLRNNLITCLTSILNRDPKPVAGTNDIFWTYNAAYRLQKSGRVGEIHGGFQNICTPAKHLLLKDVDVYNYDIKSCQAVILAEELKLCGFHCKWLETYNADKSLRKKYADEIGITEGCWKNAFYAIIMGAEAGQFGAPLKAIRKEVRCNEEAKLLAEIFIEIVQELLDACEKWRDHLLITFDSRYLYRSKKYYWWRNSCKMKFPGFKKDLEGNIISIKHKNFGGKKSIAKLKRKLAAFYLQGKEAYIIHNLTIICSENGIPVYKNEHDGIIVGARIPKLLFKSVAIEAGLPMLEIADKPICDDQKLGLITNT